jgi:hypothetical protein
VLRVQPSLAISTSGLGTPALNDSISLTTSSRPAAGSGVPVGRDHPLVDAPGGLDLDVLIDGEQRRESGGLLVGEQVGTGMQVRRAPYSGSLLRPRLVEAVRVPLAVAEKKGTMILLAPGACQVGERDMGVISLPPLWLTWDLAGRGRWPSLIRPLLGNSGRQGRALG